MSLLWIDHNLIIPLSEIEFSFTRSSGAGGQNVNKVSSKALLRWNLLHSPSVSQELRERALIQFANKIDSEGNLFIQSDRFRDQPRNKQDCLDKLRELLKSVAQPPKERVPTKATFSSKKRRLTQKERHSTKKKLRRYKDED